MIRGHFLLGAAGAVLLAACANTPSRTAYHASDAPTVGVAATTATTTSSTSATLSSGVDSTTTTERVVIGEPTAQTAPAGNVIGGAGAGTASNPAPGTPGTPSGAERGATQ